MRVTIVPVTFCRLLKTIALGDTVIMDDPEAPDVASLLLAPPSIGNRHEMPMKKVTKHAVIPAMLPLIFFAIASLPVELFGCRNRGLLAATVAIAAGVLGIVAAVRALIGRVREDANSSLWMVSAFILAIPAFFIVYSAI